MTHEPRTTEEIYESMRDSLKGKIAKLTNFTDRSFNYVWTQAVSTEVRKLEVRSTVSELAGWIDYSGGPISEEDLEQLGLEDEVSADEVNEYMQDDYLDQYVKIVGIDRLPGARATGTVTFTTQSDYTEIPRGTVVTTIPDSSGDTIAFEIPPTDNESSDPFISPDGVTTITDVPIRALEVGEEHNLPANTIVRLSDPPIGVSGVTNPESTTGGTNEESNDELRERAKQAVQSSSLGGTTDGIKGYLRQNVEGVGQGDVVLDEFTDAQPPFVDVIVDGGLDEDVTPAIEFARPTGIQHNLVRPEVVQLGFDVDIRGDTVETEGVKTDITDFLLDAGIGESFYEDELIRIIMTADSEIINIDDLGGFVERVTNETFTYNGGTSEYRLDYTYDAVNGSVTVEDKSGTQYTEGSDFDIVDQSGDSYPETLVWIGSTPEDGQDFFVDYDVTVPDSTATDDFYDSDLVRDEAFNWDESATDSFEFDVNEDTYQLSVVPFAGTTSITDASGDTYTEDTDYQLIDETGNGYVQSIDWSLSGATPDAGENFTVTYTQRVFHTEYEHRDTPGGIIRDESGNVYNQDTEYITIDYTGDGEKDAIDWQTQPSSLADGDEFFFTYYTEGDIFFADREKADPGTIMVQAD